jgi:putative phage-type endonuclease
METVVLLEDTSNRKAWLDARKGKLGSSDISAIAGLNKYRTPLQVWSEMTGRIDEPDLDEVDAVWLGNELEPVVANFFARKTGMAVKPFAKLLGRDDIPWAVATPDYLTWNDSFSGHEELFGVVPTALLECKTTAQWSERYWDDGSIPDHAHIQTQFQMGIGGFEEAFVAALIGGNSLAHVHIKYREDVFNELVTLGENFMRCVKEDTPPPAQEWDSKLLATLNNAGTLINDEIALQERVHQMWLDLYLEGEKLKKEKEAELAKCQSTQKELKLRLAQALGNHARGRVGAHVVTQKLIKKSSYIVDAHQYLDVRVKVAK